MPFVQYVSTPIDDIQADILVLAVDSNWESSDWITAIDAKLDGKLAAAINRGDVSTKLAKTTTIPWAGSLKIAAIVVVGLGEPEKNECGVRGSYFRASAAAAKCVASIRSNTKVVFAGFVPPQAQHTVDVVAGIEAGLVGQDLFKAERSLNRPSEIILQSVAPEYSVAKWIEIGSAIGQGIGTVK
jgi:leucyl aminopeptidase